MQELITSVYYPKLILCNSDLVYSLYCDDNTLLRILRINFFAKHRFETDSSRKTWAYHLHSF